MVGLRGLTWIGSISVIFLFLPSLAIKIWEYLVTAPWPNKRWLFYFLGAIVIFIIARMRWRKRSREKATNLQMNEEPIFLAKQRLAKGEIGIEEFRAIKDELNCES